MKGDGESGARRRAKQRDRGKIEEWVEREKEIEIGREGEIER